ncbi:MAG: trypsin-like peptidase domain-containing protein [Candidatus Aminicenantes bacterium]|nr:trypsin-like peptidase domain-containing protein [Candidatus Aminicenantes bacterium]
MKKLLLIVILVVGFSWMLTSFLFAQTNITGSIVKIYTVYNKHSYSRPWEMMGQWKLSGSGCIIKGNRILTNAHVVGDYTFIQVKRAGIAKKYIAEVEIVAHECELAILKVKDKSFFSGAEPLLVGELAEVGDKVATYGFPQGGDELAFTEGVVSRVEHQTYTHSNANLLSCQIDAAINPGSSGGPVIKENKIVGVAFEAGEGKNIGYMVPVPIINHFMKDIEDGKYDGIPGLGFSWQKIENPDMRLLYRMSENQSGILLNKIYPDSPAKEILKAGDVILSVEGKNIANDGTIEFRKNERTSFEYVIQNKFIDDIVEFEILRDNKVMNVKIKLSIPINHCKLVSYAQYDIAPTYCIVGGLVFEPLTLNYLVESWDPDDAPSYLANYYLYGESSNTRREVVVLISILADEINVGYQDLEDNVISYVNGEKISTIKELVKAVEKNKGKYHVFIDEWGNRIVLDKNKAEERNKIILERYKINSDRSEDLKKL